MPGIVAFRRRWSVGSDDLVVPGVFLFTIHLIWIIILTIVLIIFHYDTTEHCIELLWFYKIGYLCILFVSSCIELAICIVSMRGSILDTGPRASMKYWLYMKFVVILIDMAWLAVGIVWLKEFYIDCPIAEAKEIMLGLVICNWLVVITILITIWCTFDAAGRSWVKMKKYQRSMRESESRFNYKRSGSRNRNWRQRKVIRAYQDSWDHRCRLLFCCMGTSERNRNSFADIARLLSDFFRDLDVVPSDVVAGLVLLRKFQKLKREAIVRQKKGGTYEFLSGVPITERTQFLALNDQRDYDLFQDVIHYMHYAHGAYGWPMFLMTYSKTGICKLCSELRCCLSCCGNKESVEIVKDNCCYCNYAALKKMLKGGEVEIIYATYHVDVGETPFFVAVDYDKRKVVISIRGTLSMKDVLTDLNAEGECLPLDPPKEDWLGHKGMVQAAVYIKKVLDEENLIQRAFTHNPGRNTQNFGLVCLGHSLGAGTAAILAILLKPQYPSLVCYSYSPPGGLLSMPAVEYSKSFIISVVVGKDVVPRIGLHQMETLRADLINAIKRSIDPKWKTITCSVICCGCGPEPTSVSVMSSKDANIYAYEEQRESARQTSHHPNDSSIALTLHRPLFPPGKIIHIVRHHPSAKEQVLKKREPVYQAIWAETTDFDEVLISPVMLQDHMPDKVLSALNKVITTFGPRKPQRHSSNANSSIASDIGEDFINLDLRTQSPTSIILNNASSPHASHKICLETSFTSLQSPLDHPNNYESSSKASSLAGSLFGGKSQFSSILQYDISSILEDSGVARSLSQPSEATTVLAADSHPRTGKNVAFDVGRMTPYTMATSTPSPYPMSPSPGGGGGGILPKSILHKQSTVPLLPAVQMSQDHPSFHKRPSSLSMTGHQPQQQHQPQHHATFSPPVTVKRLDLIHDDWFGLAPLASPESLSEISSISSRTSNQLSLAASIEKCLQRISMHEDINDLLNVDESQLRTPVVMRRAPKITGNLSTCADDWRSVDTYKRMGQIFIAGQFGPNASSLNNSDSSDLSFETASNLSRGRISGGAGTGVTNVVENASRSADHLDENLNGNDHLGHAKLTNSDSRIINECNSTCPQCPCQYTASHCCRAIDHTKCVYLKKSYFNNNLINQNVNTATTNSSSGDTYYSAMSSLTGFDSSFNSSINSNSHPSHNNNIVALTMPIGFNDNEQVCTINLKTGVLESHFPVFDVDERHTLLPSTSASATPNTGGIGVNNNAPRIIHSPKFLRNFSRTRFANNGNTSGGSSSSSIVSNSNNNLMMRKRNNSDDKIFSRNESLPLLANLTEKSSPTNYVKRKRNIYPMNPSICSSSSSSKSILKGESNV